jgi:hypothetical protein
LDCWTLEDGTVAKMPEKNSLTLYREMNFSWGKRSYILLFQERKKWNSMIVSRGREVERNY